MIMDKLMLLIFMVIFISCMFGLSEAVKHKFESTWFSTIKHPKWFTDYLNPHIFPLRNLKPACVGWLFKYPLAAIDDFWHTLKLILLILIFTTIWIAYHECSWLIWMIICAPAYFLPFELNYNGFNKKEKI